MCRRPCRESLPPWFGHRSASQAAKKWTLWRPKSGHSSPAPRMKSQPSVLSTKSLCLLAQARRFYHILYLIVTFSLFKAVSHRRRIKTEEKALVVAFVWGGRLYSVPCRASYFSLRTIWKKRMNSFFCFKSSWCNSSIHPKQKQRPLPFLLSVSFFYAASYTTSFLQSHYLKLVLIGPITFSFSGAI